MGETGKEPSEGLKRDLGGREGRGCMLETSVYKKSIIFSVFAFSTDGAKDVGSNIGVQNNRKHEFLAVFLILDGANVALSLK